MERFIEDGERDGEIYGEKREVVGIPKSITK